jgi:hypothetical protein
MLFLELCVHQEQRLAELFRTLLESLFEKVTCTFELGSTLIDQLQYG